MWDRRNIVIGTGIAIASAIGVFFWSAGHRIPPAQSLPKLDSVQNSRIGSAATGERPLPSDLSGSDSPRTVAENSSKSGQHDEKSRSVKEETSKANYEADPAALKTPDASVVGRPFQVSDSVLSVCSRYAVGIDCENEITLPLKHFASEARDPAWAIAVEGQLRESVGRGNSENQIRNLECRTTLCALEVQSRQGAYLETLPLKYRRSLDAWPAGTITGFETADDGNRVYVTLRIYEKRL